MKARRGTIDTSGSTWNMISVATLSGWALDTLGNTLGYMTVADPTVGDTNLDGNVDFTDLVNYASAHANHPYTGRWIDADFNGDGVSDFTDYVDLASHYNTTGGNAATNDVRIYDGQNELIDMHNGDIELAYDDAGNQTFDQNGYTTIYDAWNRPTEVRDGVTVLTQYTYDGLGRRITEGPSGSAMHNYYNASWQLVQQNNASGVTKAQYVWSPVYIDALILRDRDADNSTVTGTDGLEERVYSQWDANFNVTSLIGDTSGSSGYQAGVIERYRYEPYGERTVLNADFSADTLAGSDSTTSDDSVAGWNKSDVLFLNGHQGGMYDAVLDGEMRFRNRTLDVEQMRWEQVDQKRYHDGLSLYSYVGENPFCRRDATGEFWHILGGAVVGAVVGAGWAAVTSTLNGDNACQVACKATVGALVGAVTGALVAAFPQIGGCIASIGANASQAAGEMACDGYCGKPCGSGGAGCAAAAAVIGSIAGCLGALSGSAGAKIDEILFGIVGPLAGNAAGGTCNLGRSFL